MKSLSCSVIILPLLFALGCVSYSDPVDAEARAGTDLPARFYVADEGEMRPARANEGCRNPMVDPRDGTLLILNRSSGDRGDYEVPSDRYGVSPNELLRIECSTGRPIGLVRN